MDQIKVHAQDYINQWSELKNQYAGKRGERRSVSGYKYPLTTNGDIKALTKWWNDELQRSLGRNPYSKGLDRASIAGWNQAKQQIDQELQSADPLAEYARNEWFWHTQVKRLAIHLNARKDRPSPLSLLAESFGEAAQDRVDNVVGA